METFEMSAVKCCILSVSEEELSLVDRANEMGSAYFIFTREGKTVFTCHGRDEKGWLPSKQELKWLAKADYFFCCYPGNLHWTWRLYAKVGCRLGFPGYKGVIHGGTVYAKDLASRAPLNLKQSSMVFSIIAE
jgi:hypothetical protein